MEITKDFLDYEYTNLKNLFSGKIFVFDQNNSQSDFSNLISLYRDYPYEIIDNVKIFRFIEEKEGKYWMRFSKLNIDSNCFLSENNVEEFSALDLSNIAKCVPSSVWCYYNEFCNHYYKFCGDLGKAFDLANSNERVILYPELEIVLSKVEAVYSLIINADNKKFEVKQINEGIVIEDLHINIEENRDYFLSLVGVIHIEEN